jgi:addiction module RelE/StbE family toxin
LKNKILQKTKTFTKDLRKLSSTLREESYHCACILCHDPFTPELDVRKLIGYKNIWRVKIKKDYRMIYTFDETALTLLRIAHRKDIYKKDFASFD